MPRSLYVFLLVWILNGCGTSHLAYTPDQLRVSLEETSFHLTAKTLKQYRESFGTLYITQRILAFKEGDFALYEDAVTDLLYEFEPPASKIIQTIFNARSLYKIYGKNHLYAYQLRLYDGRILNLLLQQNNTQELHMLYGMQSKRFDTILKRIDPDHKPVYYRNVVTLNDTQKPELTKWDVEKVHFYPLVVPLPRLMGF